MVIGPLRQTVAFAHPKASPAPTDSSKPTSCITMVWLWSFTLLGDARMEGVTSRLDPSQRLRVAHLLTLVGGFLDAYTYFERGGVFANAQTGNIVKLGIALVHGQREAYLIYLLPILAFSLGLFVSLAVVELLARSARRLVRRLVLVIEMLALGIVGLIPLGEQWDTLANCIVSFVAAMQYETFTTFRGDAIVTTMSTGNLRKCMDSLFAGIAKRDRTQLGRAARFLGIILTFMLGAALGTLSCDAMGRAAVLPAMALLAATVGIITLLHHRS